MARKHNRKFGNLNKYSISLTVRHSIENTEAKEGAFKSPLDCSLQVDAIFFQVGMYRFGDSWALIHLRYYPLSEKRFQHLDLKNSKWSLLKGYGRKRDILFPNKHQGPLARSIVGR